ncbi:class I SAM-dependent methyltransferase [Polynucleobacter paneuropaeus]|nr:class I SAM-dependent methyltransferase [Polynucleobacter paneuropaeus]MBT8533703.1 class I SAM-dependent methyltransferase [Polynucleobacter paneuropaeus]
MKIIKNISQQRVDEWEKIDEKGLNYHTIQWESPKESTLAFVEFIRSTLCSAKNVVDMGAGGGAATAFLADEFPEINFTAFDYSHELIALGKKINSIKKISNLDFEVGDWYKLNLGKKYDGCISLQTLSWLPSFETPIIEILKKIKPDFFAFTSLFYEGDITCRIEVEEHARESRKTFYNVYSLQAINRLCKEHGYEIKKYSPFNINIDIERPADKNLMGTYTELLIDKKTGLKRRIQVSGPLLMNWYMVLITRAPGN